MALAPLVRRTPATRPDRRRRRSERRRLVRRDVLSARLAELHEIDALLSRAADVVAAGWVQDVWFRVATPAGPRAVTAYDLDLVETRPIIAACLVGAVVEAGGGPGAVRSQLVQRSLDLTWHTLREDAGQPVRWGPSPEVRMMSVLQLTHWNDAPGRTQHEVVGLLESTRRAAYLQRERCLVEADALSRA